MTVARLLPARLVAALLLAGTAVSVPAQYIWLDKSGQKVFSDRAPPIDIPERSILKQPRGAAPAVPPSGLAAEGAPPPSPPRPSGQDNELAARKRQAETDESARQKAEDAKLAAQRADNCQRARQSAATLDSGVRIAQINAQGERSFMDEQTRAAESARAQSIVASDCR